MPAIHHLFTVEAPAKAVFEMLTSPDGLCQWWTSKASGEPVLGATYQFYFSEAYDWRASVIAIDAPHLISWQMEKADEDWLPTQLHFQLETSKEGTTTVRFQHSRWENVNDHYRRTSFCWAMYFDKLRRIVEEKN